MSVKAENRFKRNSLKMARNRNTEAADRESLRAQRCQRQPLNLQPTASTSKRIARHWMLTNACKYETATALAEAAAADLAFNNDPLADENHWLWDLAAEIVLLKGNQP